MTGARRRVAVALLLALANLSLVALVAAPVAAQQQRPQQRPPGDTTSRPGQDPRDTLRAPGVRPPLIDWTPDDSVMQALRRRAGYRVVQFQAAERVSFDAVTRVMQLVGSDSARASVVRDSVQLVSDTIAYDDSAKIVMARGDTIVMRDPSRGDDVLGLGQLRYDIVRREGTTRDFSTVANSGEDWRVEAHRAAFVSDSTGERNIVYGRDGIITSCLDPIPHYHFRAKELKRVSQNVIVARPVIVYVQGVPVMWLPFIFQDIREGRRSGILPPRIGFSELVRNSPSYRRTVENLGYYFAVSDYVDAQVSMDWRSSARATELDPGWTALNAQFQYRWLDRFLGGTVAVQQRALSTGNRNLALSWAHQQEFSSRTKYTSNINYVSSTQVHRQTVLNPVAAMSTILSQANFMRRQGPLNINLGGTRRQYPGRDQVDQDFPSLSVTSEPLSIGEWFTANPSLRFSQSENLNIDATGDFAYRYFQAPGGLDSTRMQRNQRSRSLAVGTPFKVFDFQVQSGFRINEQLNDFPAIRTIIDPADTTQRIQRVYAKTFLTSADFDVSIGLPQFLKGTFNLSPNINAQNVDPAGFMVRSELSNGEWVTQSKRLSYGVGISPTVYRLFGGVGPIEAMRHSLSPTLSWSYSPEASVSDEFLAALGKTQTGYLGALAQNRLSLGFATNLEARMRSRGDTLGARAPAEEKVRLASFQFTPITYDFERKRKTGRSGIATDRFGYTFRSDLLPGFDLGVDYSLFQGSVLSDTAVFKPYRQEVRATFSLTQNSSVVRGLGRLFGYQSTAATGDADNRAAFSDEPGTRVSGEGIDRLGATTGTRARASVSEIPTGQGFQAAFTVSSQRQRPPVGGRIVDFDPAVQCAQFVGLPTYEVCRQQAERRAFDNGPANPSTEGGTFFRIPPTTSVGLRTSFNLTPLWAAAWSTNYDVERSQFASQMVTLQRELHDWRAIFGFTQAPNGNFAFTFFISLKAQPEIKLDYDRQTYRPPGSTLAR